MNSVIVCLGANGYMVVQRMYLRLEVAGNNGLFEFRILRLSDELIWPCVVLTVGTKQINCILPLVYFATLEKPEKKSIRPFLKLSFISLMAPNVFPS